MPSHFFDVPVVSWPGIFSARSSASSVNLLNGEEVSSDVISILGFGEDTIGDFPSGFQPVHSWLLAWSVRISPIVFLGAGDLWHRLRIEFFEQPGGGLAVSTRTGILPLTEALLAVQASGQTRIHSLGASFTISNNIGQTVTLAWDAWAKAA